MLGEMSVVRMGRCGKRARRLQVTAPVSAPRSMARAPGMESGRCALARPMSSEAIQAVTTVIVELYAPVVSVQFCQRFE